MKNQRFINLSDMNDPDFERAFLFFCRHLVSLTGSYNTINNGPTEASSEIPFAISGFILSIRGIWNLVTAGHILKPLEEGLLSGALQLNQCYLYDDFGPDTKSSDPIPFDYINSPKYFVDDEDKGLDFALVALSPVYIALLQANGVMPITEDNWIHQNQILFDNCFLVGLPTLFQSIKRSNGTISFNIGVTILHLNKISMPEGVVRNTLFPRFVGQLGDGSKGLDIDGMSGGPILGFSKDKPGLYWIIALQSKWLKESRVVIGCPIPVIAGLIEIWLSEDDEEDSEKS